MGKKAKAAKADFRKRQKQMRKAAQRAKYAAMASAGTNSKRGKLKQKRASKFRPVKHPITPCGNQGCSRQSCSPHLAAPKFNDSTDPRVRFVVAKGSEEESLIVMFDVSKIQVVGDSILYDGDQVAFTFPERGTSNSLAELSMSEEDLVNGEVSLPKRREITANKLAIAKEIERLGYKLTRSVEENEDEDSYDYESESRSRKPKGKKLLTFRKNAF